MKPQKPLTPAMERALQDPKNRDPHIFAHDEYEVYWPSFHMSGLMGRTRTSPSNRLPRIIGKGLFVHTPNPEEMKSKSAGRQEEDAVERLVDLADRMQD